MPWGGTVTAPDNVNPHHDPALKEDCIKMIKGAAELALGSFSLVRGSLAGVPLAQRLLEKGGLTLRCRIPTTRLRLFAVCSLAVLPDMAYFKLADTLRADVTIRMYGMGDCRRDFT